MDTITKITLKQMAQNLCAGFKMSEEMLSNILVNAWDVAEEHVKETDEYKRAKAIETLSHYVSENDVEAAYDTLIQMSENGYGEHMADEYIPMWQPLEHTYTVDQLLDEIH